MKTSAFVIGLLVFACRLPVVAATADEEGVTVIGNGEARQRPNAFEFFTRVGGSAELGSDALAKFREFKRRTATAVEKLQLTDSNVDVGGFCLTSSADDRGNQMHFFRLDDDAEEPFKAEVTYSSLVRVSVRGIDRLTEEQAAEKISALFDRLKDGGVEIAPVQANTEAGEFEVQDGFSAAPVAVFVLEDATELRRLARQRAFNAARESAEELAALAGVELGGVLSMQEVSGSVISPWGGFMQDPFETPPNAADGKLRLTSRTISEIPVRARLRVRFGLKAKKTDGASLSAKEGARQ